MSQQEKINQFIERKATQYPKLDLQTRNAEEDRLVRFL